MVVDILALGLDRRGEQHEIYARFSRYPRQDMTISSSPRLACTPLRTGRFKDRALEILCGSLDDKSRVYVIREIYARFSRYL